jgi:hypothetical protein
MYGENSTLVQDAICPCFARRHYPDGHPPFPTTSLKPIGQMDPLSTATIVVNILQRLSAIEQKAKQTLVVSEKDDHDRICAALQSLSREVYEWCEQSATAPSEVKQLSVADRLEKSVQNLQNLLDTSKPSERSPSRLRKMIFRLHRKSRLMDEDLPVQVRRLRTSLSLAVELATSKASLKHVEQIRMNLEYSHSRIGSPFDPLFIPLDSKASNSQPSMIKAISENSFDFLSDRAYTKRHEKYCKRRLEHTCDWFLTTTEYRSWLEPPSKDILWCWGDAGIGKSTIM